MKPPQSPGSITTPKLAPPFYKCSTCRKAVKLPPAFVDFHFESKPITCRSCGARTTAWDVALETVKEGFKFSVFCPLGAQTAVFRTKLFLNTETRFDVFAEGLPRNALILDVAYSPEGMFCMELSGNNRRQRPKGGNLQLYGFQTYTLKDDLVEEGEVEIAVTWVESSPDDVAWNNLVTAFDAYADGMFEKSIMPANVAVEAKVHRHIESAFQGICGKDKLNDFLESAATYSYQLNVLLPFLARGANQPTLDHSVLGLLNALRVARNDVAHRGRCKTLLTKERTAELITAALFGFRYVDYLQAKSSVK